MKITSLYHLANEIISARPALQTLQIRSADAIEAAEVKLFCSALQFLTQLKALSFSLSLNLANAYEFAASIGVLTSLTSCKLYGKFFDCPN
jgi:hypothetical protein